jgi:16S rRNA (cytosine967-C5)-methyltransferase
MTPPRRPPSRLRFRGKPDARSVALEVLLACQSHKAFVQEALDRQLSRASLSPADRRLATQLAYGVLRRRGTLQALLRPLISRRPDQVEPWLWEVLFLGAYQLAFLTQIPAHAALYETVELAPRFGMPRAKGFINGVLRALLPLLTERRGSEPASDALPLEGGEYRLLARPVFPDPAASPADYLAAAFSLPRWLVQRWLARHAPEECYRLGFWFAGPGPLTLRCNPLRTSREVLLAALADAGLSAEPGEHPQAVRLQGHAPVRELPGYGEGWFCVQDESAMRVASALSPRPGDHVLDLCSAPGGKSTHLAELMQDRGEVLVCDVSAERLETVKSLAGRLGLTCIEACVLDGGREEECLLPGPFDAALVDVPCSNTGVLGRRPEVRWRLRPGDIQELVRVQARLLRLAAGRVREGGAVVYSTCSIEEEENGALVRAVLDALPGFALEAEEAAVPGRPADGGYWARLRRMGEGGTGQ